MIDFASSTFTWESHPWTPDPHYRWAGGFVGEPGQAYHVRFTLEARCKIEDHDGDPPSEFFLGAPCRSEYTIASRNLFQIPSGEWRMAFSRRSQVDIVSSDDARICSPRPLDEVFASHDIDIRERIPVRELWDADEIVEATLGKHPLNGLVVYTDADTGYTVTVEFPVNVMNLNRADGEWQICTGPVILPDLSSGRGGEIGRLYLAHVALSGFDHVEFILRRNIEVASDEAEWLDQPLGRDRLELRDPDHLPPGYPPYRPRPHVYREVREFDSENLILATDPPR
ncbi:MAG: hypothetical protein VX733_04085 [Candidatus Latescibacterota bacterium]|nr:hypothetical protein [Candidatus Latescibacterota bacterium]